MSVVIRLKTMGTKKKIKHRIVVTDTRFPRDGRFLEEVGFWEFLEEWGGGESEVGACGALDEARR